MTPDQAKAAITADLTRLVQAHCAEAGRRIVNRSPVDKTLEAGHAGQFRANWNASIGTPDLTTTMITDASGGATIGHIATVAATLKAGDKFYLTNALPYAERLESGWSGQAPNGMLSVTEVETDDIMKVAAQKTNMKVR